MAFSPLLKLDFIAWSGILDLLDPSDLPRLVFTGNQQLQERLKVNVRDLTLEWRSSRYIDVDLVLRLVSRFQQVTKIDFRQIGCTVRCWTTTDWTLLPRHLTSLRLSFACAPLLFLGQERIDLALSKLLYLDLEEGSLPQISGPHPRKLCLLHLPTSLLSLRIHSLQNMTLVIEELAHLPPGLESLELEFPTSFIGAKLNNSSHPVLLPSMPTTLKRLCLADTDDGHWMVRSKELPSTLESFQLKYTPNSALAAQLLQDGRMVQNRTALYFEGATTHLPNLRSLILQTDPVEAHLMQNYLPRSLTAVDVCMDPTSKMTPQIEAFMEFIAPRMIRYESAPPNRHSPWTEFENFLFKPRPLPSKLTFISLAYECSAELPESVTELVYTETCHGKPAVPPKSVEKMHVHCDFSIGSLLLLLPSSPLPRLQEISLCHGSIPQSTTWLNALPDSLTKLIGPLLSNTLAALFSLMNTPHRLPSLEILDCEDIIKASDALQGIPPQLKELTVSVVFNYEPWELDQDTTVPEVLEVSEVSEVPEVPEVLDLLASKFLASLASLRVSHLRKLNFTFHSTLKGNNIEIVHKITASLPETLEKFRLEGALPAPPWTFTLPPRLRSLEISWSSYCPQSYWEPTPFPNSLTHLSLSQARDVPFEILPPFLSSFYSSDGAHKWYFASEVAPSSPSSSGPEGATRTLCS